MRENDNDNRKLLEFIDKVRHRLNLNLFADMLLYGIIGGLSGWLIVNIFSMLVPVYKAEKYGAFLIIPCAVAGIVFFVIKRFSRKDAALKADLTGLKERVTTAYENMEKDDMFSKVQRADALRTISSYDVKKNFPFKVSMKKLAILLAFVLAVTVTMLIPTKARVKAEVTHGVKVEAEKKAEELEKKLEKLKEEYNLTDEQLKELDDLLKEAIKELRDSMSDEDLKRAEERFAAKSEQKLKDSLSDNFEKAKEAQKNVSLLENQTPAEQAETLAKLEQQAKDAKDAEMAKAVDDAKQELENGAISDAAMNNMDNLSQRALENAKADLEKAGMEPPKDTNNGNGDNNGSTPTGSPSPTPTGSENGNNGENNGNGEGQGNQNGNGEGQGNQNQNGEGQGGQNQNGQGQGGQNGQGWNQGSENGNENPINKTGERISVPNNTTDQNLNGKKGEGDSSKTDNGPTLTWEGTSVDYSTVVGEYTKKAYEELDTTDVPASMQDLIKDYFTEINK